MLDLFIWRNLPCATCAIKNHGVTSVPHGNDSSHYSCHLWGHVRSPPKGWCLLWTKLRQMTRCSGTWLFGRVLLTSQLHRYSSIDGRRSDCSIGGAVLVKPFGTNYGRIAYETTLAVICQNLPQGMKVIDGRHDTNAVDAARISKDSWEDIPGHQIVHCWGNAGFLPPTRQSFKMQWAKCMLRIAMRWMIFKVAYRVCKWCAYISTKYRILRAKTFTNNGKFWEIKMILMYSRDGYARDIPNILARDAIKNLKEDFPTLA